ncbi:amino acid ABC transporter permease [Streptococcus oricebi]|uniref:Amino acid ABC transporter permease n=1 Tax=Streptococcus oricebi TaxID=1547447 RepID=A0ABS5B4C7_9STRE|nr:ABC transporter permease subunit [Streptococcus oricebi]MBP2623698.1 amino acid ABC transporter permease [Streptococcus oricebi]
MVTYDFARVLKFLPDLWRALPMTLWIMILTGLIGSGLGLLLAWAQLAEEKTFAGLAKGYIFVLRCTPPIVLLFLVFYGLPKLLEWWLGLDINAWSRSIFVLITMVLLFAALIAEVFKSAYEAVPKGQLEAGLSIGLRPGQVFYRIIFPQAFRLALPNMTTAILNLMRDAALAYTVGLVDVMGAGNLLISRNLGNYSLETYTAVALIYWALALLISLLSQLLEKSLTIKERS